MNSVLLKEPNRDVQTPDKKFTLTNLCLLGLLLCCLATGFLPHRLLSVVILACCALMIGSKKIYMIYPVMLFYYSSFGTFLGMSVYRYFSLIFLITALLEIKTMKVKVSHIVALLIFTVYCLAVVAPDNAQRAIFAVIDMVCILLLINNYLQDVDNLKNFFRIYVVVSLIAFITGLHVQNTVDTQMWVDGEWVDIVRNVATFEDPNYMGYFYTAAVFGMHALQIFHPKVRIVLTVVLYAMILSTLSMTAILVNAILWVVYLLITKRVNMKVLLIVLLVIAILMGLYVYGVNHPDAPVLGMLSYRISDKLGNIENENYSDFTTGRSDLAKLHLEYFADQSFFRMVIGMNAASTLKMGLEGISEAAHNEYVDLLLNVGILGTIVLLGMVAFRLKSLYSEYVKTKDNGALCGLMCKLVWILYALTLTMYGDFRFMLFFYL